ncbi:MAG: Gfo/Idh/MocA family oxidoreductase [Planctomycetota bacterium]
MSRESLRSRRSFLRRLGAGVVASVAAAGTSQVSASAAAGREWQGSCDRKIRLGVVGGGFGAQFQWHQHPNCIVHAVSDLQPVRRDLLMKVYRCERSYESLERLIEDDQIEAVAVFTDAPSHGRHVLECLKRGKHVLCAVPAAMTLEDCQAIKEAKEHTGLHYMMAETSYYHEAVVRARNLYRAGTPLLYTEGQYYHHEVTRVPSWKGWRRALPPMLYPTHSTAYYVGVSGKRLVQVSCLGWRGPGEEWRQNGWDNNPFACESSLFRTSEGTMCRINVFWWCDAGGETGSWIWTTSPTVAVEDRVSLPPGMDYGGHGGSHGPLTNEFIMALIEGREPVIDIYESLAMVAPGIVAHQSALRDGESIRVPQFDRS